MSTEGEPVGQIQREASGFEFEIERRGEHSVRIREAKGIRYLDAVMLDDGRIILSNTGEFTPPMLAAARRKAEAILRSWRERSAPADQQKKIAS